MSNTKVFSVDSLPGMEHQTAVTLAECQAHIEANNLDITLTHNSDDEYEWYQDQYGEIVMSREWLEGERDHNVLEFLGLSENSPFVKFSKEQQQQRKEVESWVRENCEKVESYSFGKYDEIEKKGVYQEDAFEQAKKHFVNIDEDTILSGIKDANRD